MIQIVVNVGVAQGVANDREHVTKKMQVQLVKKFLL